MSLIIAKNKVNAEQLMGVETPEAADRFQPIPHFSLVEMTRDAINRAGLQVSLEEHSLARGGQRYFGGFALKGADITGSDRQIVLGLRNAHDKSFAASVCVGNRMMVCENLCFSSDIKLARRHTTNIIADLPRVLSDAVARVVSHWTDMGKRIELYKIHQFSPAVLAMMDEIVKSCEALNALIHEITGKGQARPAIAPQKAIITVAEPLDVTARWHSTYQRDGAAKKQAVRELTSTLKKSLESMTNP